MEIATTFAKIVELTEHLGIRALNKLPGCWVHKIDDQWKIALNGHSEDTRHDGHNVPAYTAYVEYNGWPAGFVAPNGGILAAGDAANEATFIAAIDRVLARGGYVDVRP